MHTHSNQWTYANVITWATTSNVRRFISCNSIRGKLGTPTGCLVGKRLGFTIVFKIFNTLGIDLFVYHLIIFLFFYLRLKLF